MRADIALRALAGTSAWHRYRRRCRPCRHVRPARRHQSDQPRRCLLHFDGDLRGDLGLARALASSVRTSSTSASSRCAARPAVRSAPPLPASRVPTAPYRTRRPPCAASPRRVRLRGCRVATRGTPVAVEIVGHRGQPGDVLAQSLHDTATSRDVVALHPLEDTRQVFARASLRAPPANRRSAVARRRACGPLLSTRACLRHERASMVCCPKYAWSPDVAGVMPIAVPPASAGDAITRRHNAARASLRPPAVPAAPQQFGNEQDARRLFDTLHSRDRIGQRAADRGDPVIREQKHFVSLNTRTNGIGQRHRSRTSVGTRAIGPTTTGTSGRTSARTVRPADANPVAVGGCACTTAITSARARRCRGA